ncbi:PTS sugar transporter subunit IIA [Pisciglobus halotolerans]|uniref:Mannitol-specific phosphotransferase enzyme IIA component n=1 Tax=Pisciglobus halotolerans TaxID=745365 RepID=A0A1I3AWB7_9LACT|nr:PTS sugar transporter subunit IIA [Pisciglobus halotolerans]SFH54322.1 PTS system D-mannitol-specific IIA component, Fru family [Pisciglobus halotolerans]
MNILEKKNIQLNQSFQTKEEAIRAAGQLLVNNGYADQSYVDSMLERESKVSTYMGNFIAIPHGTDESKELIKASGISVLQVPDGVNFGEAGEDKLVTVVFGIAGVGNEHLDILSQIAVYCSEIENVVRLADAKSEEEIIDLLGGIE